MPAGRIVVALGRPPQSRCWRSMRERDFLNVLEALAHSGVRYVVVGGTAVVLHGHLRVTADLDLVVALDPPNVLAAIGALESLGFKPQIPVRAQEFADPQTRRKWIEDKGMTVFSMWTPFVRGFTVDLFVKEPIPFEELYERADRFVVGSTEVAVASIPDLIALKRKAGRPIDIEDIRVLEAVELTRSQGERP